MIVLALLSLNSVAQVITFEGVTLGQSMDDTLYNLGYPQKVLYPENKKTLSRDQHGQPIVNLLLFADDEKIGRI